MRKTASILSFLLGLGFLIAFGQMNLYDVDHSAENTQRSFDQLHAGQYADFKDDLQASQARQTEEKIYGILGLVAGIAGFALWPYDRKPGARPETQPAA